MYGWQNNPVAVDCTTFEDGTKQYLVGYGKYQLTVKPDGTATCIDRRRRTGVEGVLPNTEFDNGSLCIAIEDIVQEIINRAKPEELAESLWQDEHVRSSFIDSLVNYYHEQPDEARRELLSKLKERVHDIALDEAVAALSKMEHDANRYFNYYDAVRRANEILTLYNVTDDNNELVQMVAPKYDSESTSESWQESRSHWREVMKNKFPVQDGET